MYQNERDVTDTTSSKIQNKNLIELSHNKSMTIHKFIVLKKSITSTYNI